MHQEERLSPIIAAEKVIETYFPKSHGAILAGSVIRDEETETSDLDIIVFDKSLDSSYRESFLAFGWPVEAFVHSDQSYCPFFEMIGNELSLRCLK